MKIFSVSSGCLLLGVVTLLASLLPLRVTARSVRDVSHLEYLPPLPSRDYLPPLIEKEKLGDSNIAADINNEYLPPKVNNEYLPPGDQVKEVIEQAEEQLTEEPSTTTIATTTTTEDIPTEVSSIATSEEPYAEELTDAKQDTAVLLADGYHYKSPEVVEELLGIVSPVTEEEAPQEEPQLEDEPEQPQGEYLPPLEESVVVADGPANQETAVLADDGYHYRAIRRLRF